MPEKLCRWTEQDFKNSILLSLFHVLFKVAKAIRSHQNWFLNPQVCSWEGFFPWEGASSTSVASGFLFRVGKSAQPPVLPPVLPCSGVLWDSPSTTIPVSMAWAVQKDNSAGKGPRGHQRAQSSAGCEVSAPEGLEAVWDPQGVKGSTGHKGISFTWTALPGEGDSTPGDDPHVLFNSLPWVCHDISGLCPNGRGCAKVL